MDCGAKTRSGNSCKAKARANGRCRIHGGNSLKGLASPSLVNGRHSRYLPGRLLERYHEALTDGDLLALREEIAVLDARLTDVLGRVDTGESGEVWAALREQFAEYELAQNSRDHLAQVCAFNAIKLLIERGLQDYAAWSDVRSLIEQRRKMVESEHKRLVAMQQTITAEQAMVLLAAVVDTVKRHVTDRNALAAISADISKLVALPIRHVNSGAA